MDALTAARLQMTVSLAFHMVFAAIGIGLPLLLVLVEGRYLRSGDAHDLALAKRWAKVTGLLFAVGAISGTALALELGLLWPRYMEITGAVVGHVFGLEGYAFFLEAIFIGLYLYGWDKLSPRTHWLCGVVIAVSGMISGILVLGVNAWMQLPVGFTMDGDRVAVTDPIAIFKRPGWFYMAWHSTLSCYISVAFAVAGYYAYVALRGRGDSSTARAVRIAMALGAVTAFLQPISGDLLAKFVFQTQTAKFAAMEGQFKTERHAPLRIGGWPDEAAHETRWALEIPGGLSFLATHDLQAEVPGLDQVPRADWPNVELTHLSFQVMVGLGSWLMLLSLWYWLASWRGGANFAPSRRLLWALAASAPLGFIALEAGWMVTEVGRQPWVINGVLRTADAVTTADSVHETFFLFTLLYIVLTVTVVVLLLRMARPAQGATR